MVPIPVVKTIPVSTQRLPASSRSVSCLRLWAARVDAAPEGSINVRALRAVLGSTSRNLPEKLRAEADGILRWAVEGFKLWQAEGLGDPPDVAEARQAWREECDPVGDFIAECCRTDDPDEWVLASELRLRYEHWCGDASEKYPLGSRAFGQRIRALGCTYDRETVEGKTQRVWTGIGIL